MLAVEDLVCAYGDVTAVRGISFAVEAGSIFALIGANGAGKTTTIMALAGLIKPGTGRIVLNGRDVTAEPARQRVGQGMALVPEGRRVFADLTVDDNLTVGGHHLPRAELERLRQRVQDIFPRLVERRGQLAGSLSGGEQQMLAIGRALMAAPTVLLVDELSLGLMPKAVDECYRVLDRLRDEGLAIVLVEQSTERALAVADQVAVLESGAITWRGTGAEAMSEERVIAAYLGV